MLGLSIFAENLEALRKEIRFVLAGLVLLFAVFQFIEVNIGYGIMLVLLSGLIVLSIFKNERILMALYHLRKNNMSKAEKAISGIKHPEYLVKSQEAYFYLLNGMLISQSQSPMKAEKMFLKALNTGLRLKEDQAVAKLNLAGISATKRRKREAINYLQEAKKLDTRKLLTDQIKMLQSQMGRI